MFLSFLRLTPVLLAVVLPSVLAQNGPNLVQNPGFESHGPTPDGTTTDITSWNNNGWEAFTDDDLNNPLPTVDFIPGTSTGFAQQASIKLTSTNPNAISTISQALPTALGSGITACYVLAFDGSSGYTRDPNTFQLLFRIGGLTGEARFLVASQSTNSKYARLSILLPLTGDNNAITFSGYGPSSTYIAIDQVYVAKAANTILSGNTCVCAPGFTYSTTADACQLNPSSQGQRARRSKRTKLNFGGVPW